MATHQSSICVVLEDSSGGGEHLETRLKMLADQSTLARECWIQTSQQGAERARNLLSSKKWPWPITIVEIEDYRLAQARNKAIEETHCQWIIFWQENFMWQPHTLEAMTTDSHRDSPVMVFSNVELKGAGHTPQPTLFEHWPGFRRFFNHSPWRPISLKGSAFQSLLGEPVCCGSAVLYAVEMLKRSGGISENLPTEAQLWDACLRLSLQGIVSATPYPWVSWQQSGTDSTLPYIRACEAIHERYAVQLARLPMLMKRRAKARLAQAYSHFYLALKCPGQAIAHLLRASYQLPERRTWQGWHAAFNHLWQQLLPPRYSGGQHTPA